MTKKTLLWLIPACIAALAVTAIGVKWMSAPCTDTFAEAMGWESVPSYASYNKSYSSDSGSTQSQLNENVKSESIYITAQNYNSTPAGSFAKATGTVKTIQGDTSQFVLTENVNNGAMVFTIENLSLNPVKDGETVSAWGSLGMNSEKENSITGLPEIFATIIEKQN